MQGYPHIYTTGASAGAETPVRISGAGLEDIETMPPPEFGGPDGYWSPEMLLVASVADCFILTFRAIARASRVDWIEIDCRTDGHLDRVDGVTRFTRFDLRARLRLPSDADAEKAERIMHKAEAVCLVTRSLTAEVNLETELEFADR